jgi:type VI secretion system secreted protein Hcp
MAISKVDIFLKLDGIEGESPDDKHKNEIEIQSFSWGVTNGGTFAAGSGGGSKHANLQDVSFTKLIDKSSPKLFLASATGDHIKSGLFTFRKAGKQDGQVEYLKIKLSELLISSYHLSDHAGGDLPAEQVSINFSKIEIEYKEQKQDGSLGGAITAGYDIKAAKKV